MLWQILAQFIFRLCFGLAAMMAVTSPKQVGSGFYRVNLWVLLGLDTFASLIVFSSPAMSTRPSLLLGLSIFAAVLAYVGSVVWLYELRRPGVILLGLVAATNFLAADRASSASIDFGQWAWLLADIFTSGLVLGTTVTAMLLGHWYLNSPTMKLQPLQRLILLTIAAVVVRALLCATGLLAGPPRDFDFFFLSVLGLRWLAGLVGTLSLGWMSWQTLRIPNTQSATGILYVAVVFGFLGELASRLLSADSAFPL